jgi:acetyl esterase/lipase
MRWSGYGAATRVEDTTRSNLMGTSDRKRHEYRVRLEKEAAAHETEGDASEQPETDAAARMQRMENQTLWVDLQVRAAMERGEFDNLPGAGKPIPGLDAPHDPDWWLKSLIERERITGVLPPALALRKENEVLEDALDREVTEDSVRRVLEDFNSRIIDARRQLQGGPPVVTPLRDVDLELEAWSARRRARRAQQQDLLERQRSQRAREPRTTWLRRLLDRVRSV